MDLEGCEMTKDEAVILLCEHFSEGMVRTIVDAIAEDEREECAKICETLELPEWPDKVRQPLAKAIRARGQE